MKKTILFISLVVFAGAIFAQKKTTTSGSISFDATTSLDKLPKADNKTAVAALDTKKGTVAFEAIVKSFSFGNPMMQDHFNSPKWLDSEKYPTTTFKGKIVNLSEVNFNADGIYKATIEGEMTLHGVTKPLTTTAIITVSGKSINATSDFSVKLDEYGINVNAVGGKVANDPKISVSAEFK